MKNLKVFFPVLFLLIISCSKPATPVLELPSLISDGMVLQQKTDAKLWGRSNPGDKISINTSWGTRASCRADRDGNWTAEIETREAGGPFEIAIQTRDTSTVISDVYLGEVWLGSGQSNMEMTLTGWPPNDTILNSASEIAHADYPEMRFFNVTRTVSASPLADCNGTWTICSPETAAKFSATAYFFGRALHKKLNVPVGIITSSWGGTPAEAWTPLEALEPMPAYADIAEKLKIAAVQYDSLLNWMQMLPYELINDEDKNYYAKIAVQDEKYASPDCDDALWDSHKVPLNWDKGKLPSFDGIVWFRHTFQVPAEMVGKEATLNLGPIDDMDITYLNGKKVGEIMELGKWQVSRHYTIPPGVLRKGENVLAVRIIDNTGGGGIYGSDPVTLTTKNGKSIVLDGEWKYLPVAEILSNKIFFYTDENTFYMQPKMIMRMGSSTPTTLYNGMIHPLVPFTIKGVVWYQGEANVGRGFEYRTLFPTMISSWRSVWDQGDFPFYYVQIAPYDYMEETPSPTAEVREAQLLSMSVPRTGMVVTMDIGNPKNIHPADKQDVGMRLALWALAKDYGYDTLVYSGPIYDSLKIEGNQARVYFNFVDGGLSAKDGPLTYFEIAGADQVYYPATAVIDGETVLVTSEKVAAPVAVRYGWSDIAEPNLFNASGLPASPFRTDSWKRLSEY